MTSYPTINHGFTHTMESHRHLKRFTRPWFDHIRATDYQTKKLGQAAIQRHYDSIEFQRQQVNFQQQLKKEQEDRFKLLETQHKETMKILENIVLLLKKSLPEEKHVLDARNKRIEESTTKKSNKD